MSLTERGQNNGERNTRGKKRNKRTRVKGKGKEERRKQGLAKLK